MELIVGLVFTVGLCALILIRAFKAKKKEQIKTQEGVFTAPEDGTYEVTMLAPNHVMMHAEVASTQDLVTLPTGHGVVGEAAGFRIMSDEEIEENFKSAIEKVKAKSKKKKKKATKKAKKKTTKKRK